jgi:hypothetical protein
VVVHACSTNIQEIKAGRSQVQASLGYKVKHSLKKKTHKQMPGVVVHNCNPSTCEAVQEDFEFEASLGIH